MTRYTGSVICRKCKIELPDSQFGVTRSGHRSFVCFGCTPSPQKLERVNKVQAAHDKVQRVMMHKVKTCTACGVAKPNNFESFQKEPCGMKGLFATSKMCLECRGKRISAGFAKSKAKEEAYLVYKATGDTATSAADLHKQREEEFLARKAADDARRKESPLSPLEELELRQKEWADRNKLDLED